MRGEIAAVPFQRSGTGVTLDLTLEPLESVLLVFQPHPRFASAAGAQVQSGPGDPRVGPRWFHP